MEFYTPKYTPSEKATHSSNLYKVMKSVDILNYKDFYNWSNIHREEFWSLTCEKLGILFQKKAPKTLDLRNGAENALWFSEAQLNIVESCFLAAGEQKAIISQKSPESSISSISYSELKKLCCRIANGLREIDIQTGDTVAIDMPMTVEAIAIYLASIMAGVKVVTIADSFSSDEIKVRLDIAKAKVVFTVDNYLRAGKEIFIYKKIKDAGHYPCIVIQNSGTKLHKTDSS
ncbi:MAG: AMP-binding protein, partial [Lentisphaeraceae bacterium]|nr:AMP-binding protein [Lentisphaeraceae bacterium]